MNIIKHKRSAIFSFSFILILAFSLLISGCGGGVSTGLSLVGDNNPGDNQGPISPSDLIPSNPAPPAPVITTAEATTNSVYLKWMDESPRESGFLIIRDGVKVGETDKNISQWTDSSVLPDTTYTYVVVAWNKEGSSASPEKTVTTPAVPVPKLVLPPGAHVRSLAVDQTTRELYAVGEIAVNAPNNILDNNGIIAKFNPDGAQICSKQFGTNTWDVVFDIAMYNGEAYALWSDIAGNGTVSVFNDACVEVRSLDIGHISAVHLAIDQSGIYFNNGIKMDFQGAIVSWGPSLPWTLYTFDDVAIYNSTTYHAGSSWLVGDHWSEGYVAAIDNTTNNNNIIWTSRWGEEISSGHYRIIAGAYGVYTVNNDLKVTHHDLGGNLLWTYQDTAQRGTFVNDIVADNDAVYIIGSHDLVKINAADGTVAWRTTIITAFDFDYLALFNNVLYVAKGHTNMILRYNTLTGLALP